MQDQQPHGADLQDPGPSTQPLEPEASSASAGRLLRQAREAAHIHAEVLAGTLKVPLAKIEALENDDWANLPDIPFTRALASSICRQLKMAPEPVLALLPSVRQQAPEAPATLAADKALAASRQKLSTAPVQRKVWPWVLAVALLAGAAGTGLWWQLSAHTLPVFDQNFGASVAPLDAVSEFAGSVLPLGQTPSAALVAESASALASAPALATVVPAAPMASSVTSAAQQVVPTQLPSPLASATTAAITAAATMTAVPTAMPTAVSPANSTGLLELQAQAECWVQVSDAQKKVQLSRLLHAGERVQIQSRPPYRIWAGRAEALQITWQGKPVQAWAGKTGSQRLQLPLQSEPTAQPQGGRPQP